MKVGDRITIGGKKFKIMYVYEDYILACAADADPDTMATSILVFKVAAEKKLKLITDKEDIKFVITKLFEEIQGKN